jgi:hypothetical protein
MIKVATVVQQIMTEFSEAVSKRDKIMVITIMVKNSVAFSPQANYTVGYNNGT